jgi:hypothetical protein
MTFLIDIINLKPEKMKIVTTALLLMIALNSCQFSKSVKKDLASGLLTTGDGLSCDDVYIAVNDEKVNRNTFIYGEEFVIKFNDIEGFTKENDYLFPGMKLVVTSIAGDTVLQSKDLYSEYPNGMKLSPLLLTSILSVASPMKSKGEYSLNILIWDKKGDGHFTAKLDFKVEPNENIVTSSLNVKCDEIYLYSEERAKVIPGNKIRFNENTYFIFEGLSGFTEINGMVFPGLSLKATDNDGNVILDYPDLFSDYDDKGLAVTDFNSRVTSNFIIPASQFKNPLHCELIIKDKKSDAMINVKADLILE